MTTMMSDALCRAANYGSYYGGQPVGGAYRPLFLVTHIIANAPERRVIGKTVQNVMSEVYPTEELARTNLDMQRLGLAAEWVNQRYMENPLVYGKYAKYVSANGKLRLDVVAPDWIAIMADIRSATGIEHQFLLQTILTRSPLPC